MPSIFLRTRKSESPVVMLSLDDYHAMEIIKDTHKLAIITFLVYGEIIKDTHKLAIITFLVYYLISFILWVIYVFEF